MDDPSLDWLLAVRVAAFCDTFRETVILTWFLVEADSPDFCRFARIGVIIYESASVKGPRMQRELILHNLWNYEEVGGLYRESLLRGSKTTGLTCGKSKTSLCR